MKRLAMLIAFSISTAAFPAQRTPVEKAEEWTGKSEVPGLGIIELKRHKWTLKHELLYPEDSTKPSSFVFETSEDPFIRLTIQRYPTKTTNTLGANPHVYGDLIVETIGAGLGLPLELHQLLKKDESGKPRLANTQGVSWDAVTPKTGKPYLKMITIHHFEIDNEEPWMQVSRTTLSEDETAVWIVAVTSQTVLFPDVSDYVSFRR